MIRSLWIAKTGLNAEQTRMDVIANNIANVNTTGYKRERAVFADLLYQNLRQAGAQSSQQTQLPSGLEIGTGVRTVATERLFSEGNLTQTNNPLDVAINGNGFLQVLLPNGTLAYTRAGNLELNNQGQVVTPEGYPVQPAIAIPQGATSVTIAADGTVSVTLPGQAQAQQIGNLQLATFVNPAGLQASGDNQYLETTASGPPTTGQPGVNGVGTLRQGFLETSNVNVVQELVNMIATQRAYEVNSKMVQASNQMMQYANNTL